MAEWTLVDVADRFTEAALTAYRLPSVHIAGYVRFWPDMGGRYADERPALLRLPATPAAVDRFVEATRWLRWLTEEQRHLVWARAQRRPWKVICTRLHCNRATARRHWQHALATIVVRLNGEAPRIVITQDRSVR